MCFGNRIFRKESSRAKIERDIIRYNGGHPTDGGAGTPRVNQRNALGGCFIALREHRDRVLWDRVSRVRDEEWAKSCFVEQDF